MDKDKTYEKLTVKSLEGRAEYAFWRRNDRAYLTLNDPLLLRLKPEPLGTSNAAISKWREASAQANGTLKLILREVVLICAIQLEKMMKRMHSNFGNF